MMKIKWNFFGKIPTRISKMFLFFVAVKAFSFVAQPVWANNIRITNFAVIDTNEVANTITFTCDVSWDNSWRNTTNHDAIWIFLKYSMDAGLTWSHTSMAADGINPIGFNAPVGFEIIVPNDEKGFFLQRTDLSSGSVMAKNVRFAWDYGQDRLSDVEAMAANTVNKIFGIEMVYVPHGSFYAGDGNSSSDYRFKQGSTDEEPWYIQSETAITTTNSANDGFYYQSTGAVGESSTGSVFLIPTSFPKGYQAIYVMKYELTEGQWVSFFNTLSTVAKVNRDITSSVQGGKGSDGVVDRNTIAWDSSKATLEATTLRPDRPVTYISWPDLLAYADWAALRPMTELEFEKTARGKDIQPIPDEFVWGTTSYNQAEAGEIFADSDEDGTEQIFDSTANLNRNALGWSSGDGRLGGIAQGQKGPLRAGIFAEISTNRPTSGAGFYGNMELSGNLHEIVVAVGRAQARQFLGSHGDGLLSTLSGYEGNATNIDWPGISTIDSARGVTGTVGSGCRGGDFQSSNIRFFQISTRTYAAKDPDSEGYRQRYDSAFGIFLGGRLARTSP